MITYGNAFCKGLIFVRVRNDEESKFMIEYAEDHEVVVNDDDSYFNVNTYKNFPCYIVDEYKEDFQLNGYKEDYVRDQCIKGINFDIFYSNFDKQFIGFEDKKTELISVRRKKDGNHLDYYELDYLNINNNLKTYEMVSDKKNLHIGNIGENKSNSVIMLVFNDDKSKMLLTKEFRMGVNNYVYGEPAGMIDEGESIEEAADRELYEETGLKFSKILKVLNNTYTCAPITDMITTVVIGIANGKLRDDNDFESENEEIYSDWYTKEEVKALLDNKEVMFAGRAQAFAYSWAYGL